ncbi:hypothetical protein QU481_14225 [Crenobacter sp. SG2303]|uniref:Uncharacterized protein n=1 Tax=Crenobacter oryzisoli TaxID=3056844 RepID=A0ABT7XR48_9NEIS|nr:hypothetical protein [Crenobacter sp. SG2303]MDN0076044.1 hypothetical protein [Crenobacter sp. SG2303]
MLTVTAIGSAPHLAWFSQRLAGQGNTAAPGPPPAGLPEWTGLCLGSLCIDSADGLHWARQERAAQCHALGLDYVELAGPWQEQGTQWGFILFVGGDEAALQRARPLLDALAPLPGAWMHCGPAGAASFTACVLAALSLPLAALPTLSPELSPRDITDWQAILSHQLETVRQLGILARDYLQSQGLREAPPSLSEPSPHYAALLAQLLLVLATPLDTAGDAP